MRSPRILILYNEPVLPVHHHEADSEYEILGTVECVSKTLIQAGFEVSRLGVSRDPAVLLTGLRDQRPDAVFNLFEGTADQGNTEAVVAGLLEWLGVPFTGCPAHTLTLARHKHLTKHLLQGAGIPTPPFFIAEQVPVTESPIDFPLIVKPATQDASIGLDQGSVVTDLDSLNQRIAHVLKSYGPPVLVEEFIPGRELNVALVEIPDLRVLPVSEVEFINKDPDYWPIVTYDAKWRPGSRDYEATPPRYPADISPRLAERLGALAQQAFRLLGCRDYARIDFRVKPSGKPYVLEVNPNPDFSPSAGLSGAISSAGLTHAQVTVELVRATLARAGKPTTIPAPLTVEPPVRDATIADRAVVRRIVESCGLFRSEEVLAALEVVESALKSGPRRPAAHCLVIEQDREVIGAAGFGKAARTDGTYNLYWIAIAPPYQGKGFGYRLLQAVEAWIQAVGGKVLIAETSAQQGYTRARQFYLRQGFRLVGDVPDFYREGDGRLTYAKYLGTGR